MKKTVNLKDMSREELEKNFIELSAKNEALSQENTWYKEQVKLQQKKLFGKSSEKVDDNQLSLFNEVELESTMLNDESKILEVKSHNRKKKSKKLNTEDLVSTTVTYTLSDEEQICPNCDSDLHVMSTNIRKEIIFIAPKLEVINHVENIYSCRNCEKNDVEATIVKANGPEPLIKGSHASASLVSNIINDKYVKALPLYRQEISYKRLGINLTRQNMSNWIIKVANSYFKPMISYMHKQLLNMEYISADETTVNVLHDPAKPNRSKSYIWVYMSGRNEAKQLVLYNYETSRAHNHVVKYLNNYTGIVLSDGYKAYDELKDVTQAGCWVHARRYFHDTLELIPKDQDKKTTKTWECFEMINDILGIEKKYKDEAYDNLTKIRQEETLPIVNKFYELIHELNQVSLPKSHLGKAVTYAINQETKLRTFLSDGRIEAHNNITERAIRPFTIGRKNWMFMNTAQGAVASSMIYSLVESAKLNNLKPYDYINYLLTILPGKDLSDESYLETIMPWSELPKTLYEPKKS